MGDRYTHEDEDLMPGIPKPYKRTSRPMENGDYGGGDYQRHPEFANSARQFIRAFEIIQKDLMEVFDYVEPSELNKPCYSYRIHELHTRACIEVEANCTAILSENGYAKAGNWNMEDYKKLEVTHHLSSYEVRLPIWHGAGQIRTPFGPWKNATPLPWYQAYNQTKHSRHANFHLSNFNVLVDSVCGLVAMLASQFHLDDFGQNFIYAGGPGDGFQYAIGGYFLIRFPNDWSAEQRYSFNWQQLRNDPSPIQTLQY